MQIILNPSEVAKIQGSSGEMLEVNEVLLRAVSLLKTIINVSWEKVETGPGENKENSNGQNVQENEPEDQFLIDISLSDRNFIKANIFNALYVAVATIQSPVITSELECIVYNIAEVEEEGTWPECEQSIDQCLKDKDIGLQIVGLRCLREVCRAHHQNIDEDRRKLHALAEKFLPQLEQIFAAVSADGENPHQMDMMVLIQKIFFFFNYSGIALYLV